MRDVTAVLLVDDVDVLTQWARLGLHFTFAGVQFAIRTTQRTGPVLQHTHCVIHLFYRL